MIHRMSVWRLEHPSSGKGPYTHDWHMQGEIKDAHNKCPLHPSLWMPGEPWEGFDDIFDNPLVLAKHYPNRLRKEKAGFIYLEQLREWFGEWLKPCLAAGFVVKEYLIEESKIRIGSRQVTFCIEGELWDGM